MDPASRRDPPDSVVVVDTGLSATLVGRRLWSLAEVLGEIAALVGMLSDNLALIVPLRPSVDDQAVLPQAVLPQGVRSNRAVLYQAGAQPAPQGGRRP